MTNYEKALNQVQHIVSSLHRIDPNKGGMTVEYARLLRERHKKSLSELEAAKEEIIGVHHGGSTRAGI